MKRTLIKIDENLCNGCGLCIEGCHEGALQLIDGKARMISDLYCDGLGACIGECPVQAITFVEREAEPYDEIKVMERLSAKGEATIIAHINHLVDHNQHEYVSQAKQFIIDNKLNIDLSRLKSNHFKSNANNNLLRNPEKMIHQSPMEGGCPGSRMMAFDRPNSNQHDNTLNTMEKEQLSELRQWPVQMHLVNPQAPYFQKADVVLAADCVAYSIGNFHAKYLRGKGLAIACPKLDSGKEIYVDKLVAMIELAKINTLTVMIMEVPCCNGLLQMAAEAKGKATRKVPLKAITVGLDGEIRDEEWV